MVKFYVLSKKNIIERGGGGGGRLIKDLKDIKVWRKIDKELE